MRGMYHTEGHKRFRDFGGNTQDKGDSIKIRIGGYGLVLAERTGFAVCFASFLLGRSFLARAAKNANTVAFSLRLAPSRVQILSHQNKKPAPCANFLFWQRGRDLNPRYAHHVNTISN